MRIRHIATGIAIVAGSTVLASPALADPIGAKNAFAFDATCGARTIQIVVNSANGRGQGAQDQTTAEFAPGLVVGTNEVLHPTAFDLTFTFTPADGSTPQSFTDTSSRKNQSGDVTCQIDASQTDDQGNTFSIVGSVTGWIS
jgi:hypothetical protein